MATPNTENFRDFAVSPLCFVERRPAIIVERQTDVDFAAGSRTVVAKDQIRFQCSTKSAPLPSDTVEAASSEQDSARLRPPEGEGIRPDPGLLQPAMEVRALLFPFEMGRPDDRDADPGLLRPLRQAHHDEAEASDRE